MDIPLLKTNSKITVVLMVQKDNIRQVVGDLMATDDNGIIIKKNNTIWGIPWHNVKLFMQ